MPSSVRGRIVLAFIIVSVAFAGIIGTALWFAHQHDLAVEAAKRDSATALHLKDAQIDSSASNNDLFLYVMTGNEQLAGNVQPLQDRALTEARQAGALLDATQEAGEVTELNAIIQGSAPIWADAQTVIELRRSGDTTAATQLAANDALALGDFLRRYNDLGIAEEQQSASRLSEAQRTSELVGNVLLASGLLGIVLTAGAALFVGRSVFKPLSRLQTSALAIASGQLNMRAPENGPKELAGLGAAFNQMTNELLDVSHRRELVEQRERAYVELAASRKELADLGERLNSVVSSIDDLVYSGSADTLHTDYVSPAVQKIFGVSAQQMYDNPLLWLQMVHPEDQPNLRQTFAAAYQDGHAEIDFRIVRPDGSVRWLRNRASISADEFGIPSRIDGVCSDITDRKQAEESLRESEERLRLLFEYAPDPIYLMSLSGVFLDGNRAAEEFVGYPRDELIGVNFASTGLLSPDQLVRAAENLRKNATGLAGEPLELELQRKDGSKVVTEIRTFPVSLKGESVVLGIARDMTRRKQLEDALRQSEQYFRSLIEDGADVMLALDHRGFITYASPSATRVLGYSQEEMSGAQASDLVHPEDLARATGAFRDALLGDNLSSAIEFRVRRKDGQWLVFEALTRPGSITDGQPSAIANCRDVTERKQSEDTIRHMAYHDPLTGLPNRTLFNDRFRVALRRARRRKQNLCVMAFDVDRFKFINDTLGHSTGDLLLRSVASRLRRVTRASDTLARLGGDEFTLLVSGDTSPERALALAEKVRATFSKPVRIEDNELLTTVSVGVAFYPADGKDAETLVKNADTAMYRAKEQGGNTCVMYKAVMDARTLERLTLETALRQALANQELEVHYQPKVSAVDGSIVAAEALVRWRRPGSELVLPAEFIPLAEESGLIVPLGEFVLRRSCLQAREWEDEGWLWRVAVNVSARQFQDERFVDMVIGVLNETGLDPARLELEITETTAMKDVHFAISIMHRLARLGVRFAIDDFGTGNSSMRYLRDFPIATVKIDKSFIDEIGEDGKGDAIVTTMIELSHSLKLQVVAEGVETEAQVLRLQMMGCDVLQGFFFSRPVPEEELVHARLEILRKWAALKTSAPRKSSPALAGAPGSGGGTRPL